MCDTRLLEAGDAAVPNLHKAFSLRELPFLQPGVLQGLLGSAQGASQGWNLVVCQSIVAVGSDLTVVRWRLLQLLNHQATFYHGPGSSSLAPSVLTNNRHAERFLLRSKSPTTPTPVFPCLRRRRAQRSLVALVQTRLRRCAWSANLDAKCSMRVPGRLLLALQPTRLIEWCTKPALNAIAIHPLLTTAISRSQFALLSTKSFATGYLTCTSSRTATSSTSTSQFITTDFMPI